MKATIAEKEITVISPVLNDSGLESSAMLQIDWLAVSKLGVSPVRKLVVYLPAGHDEEMKRYPSSIFSKAPSGDIVSSLIGVARKACSTAQLPQVRLENSCAFQWT
jgi:hypothetical protein